jgi:dihydroorotase
MTVTPLARPVAYINARLIDPARELDAPGGVLVQGTEIRAAGPELLAPQGLDADLVDCGGRVLAPGLIDLRVKTGEPGAAHVETLASASAAALAGGVTTFVVQPDTDPVIDSAALVQFLARRATATARARVLVAGALTAGLAGERIAEIGLMAEAGAVMFSNGDRPVCSAKVLRRAMTYANGHHALIASRPDDPSLSDGGVMHAGPFAAGRGVRGIGFEAEWLGASRDLLLAEATGARLLVDLVSTARTVDMVHTARERGVDAYVSASILNLYFNELDVGDYLTYCKVNPPFRPEPIRRELVEALAARRLHALVSAHDPRPPEMKRLPIDEAAFGAIGVETLLAAGLALVHAGDVSLLDLLWPLTVGPAQLLGLPQGRLKPGAPADIVIFDPETPWKCVRENLRSLSQNSPWDGRRLEGRVWRTLVGGEVAFEGGR